MVLDMKKRLSTLIPSSARASLQNVLTVEWDTHKTVLVEVPGGGSSRSNEVEMSGLESRPHADYGKLDDEDDYEERSGLFNQSSFGKSRSGWADEDDQSDSRRPQGSLKKKPPTRPSPSRNQWAIQEDGNGINDDDNPFDENSPTYRSALSSAPALPSRPQHNFNPKSSDLYGSQRNDLPPALGSDRHDLRRQTTEWQTFENTYEVDGKGKKMDPWSQSGGWSQTTSPTSSRGTRHSGQLEAEDPFQ